MTPERLAEITAFITPKLFPRGGFAEVKELLEAVKASLPRPGHEWLPCLLSVSGWSDIHDKPTWERSTGHFHGGTTWEALVLMEPDNYEELRQAMSEGAYCDFRMYPETLEESRNASKPQPKE